MAITKLTNTQIHTLVNEAYKQMTGLEDITELDLTTFTDNGVKDVLALREKFTGALIGVTTKNWFTDSSYRSQYRDVFFEDASQFGAIVQAISVTVPEVKASSSWKNFETGVTKVGQYDVYLPIVETQYYTKSTSWALPITITGEQWDTAFKSESDLADFVSYIFMMVDNAIVQHLEDMNALNRNNFIAEKINYSEDQAGEGIHVIDLVKGYAEANAISTSFTVEQALADSDFLIYAINQLILYKDYFKKQNALFNTEGKVRFTPEDRLVIQMISAFERLLEANGRSEVYHNELITLPLHESIPCWQGLGDLSFDDVTSIHVETENGTVERSGIVAFMCDKWAIMHTIKSKRVASQHFNIENITNYEYQFRDQYMNNLTMNAVVFVMNDYTVE